MHDVSGYGILLDIGHGCAYTVCVVNPSDDFFVDMFLPLTIAVSTTSLPPKAMIFSCHRTLCN